MAETVTAKDLATVLREPARFMLVRALKVLGSERCIAILVEALTIESHGGMLTRAGDRRRTVGGIFLALCRERTTAEERAMIFRRASRRA